MCDFRDFTQNGLWSGQGDRYARSVSVFPDMNREYCVVRRRCATPARMDSDLLLPYCSSTAEDLRRMKRELYSPGPMDSEGLYPMERRMLLPPERPFTPDVQQICYPRTRRDILSIEREIDEQSRARHDILSIEREIDERSWASLHGRMRSPLEFSTQAHPIPRPDRDIQFNSIAPKYGVRPVPHHVRPGVAAYKHDRNLYLASTPKKKSFFPLFFKGVRP